MASVRTSVIDLLVTELKKINGEKVSPVTNANFIVPYTFKSNVFNKNVFRHWKFLNEINDFPTICFMVGAVTRQHVGGDVRYEFFEVNFRGYVHGENSLNLADDLSEDIDYVVNSFRNTALTADNTLEVSDALVLDISTDEGLFDPYGICDIRSQVSYRYHLA
jgi:hypothetical protein